ncbi:DUF4276 family protein [Xanthomonas arboricola]|uniref:DUF4276 family protein n=1 Tax=Xanthomonas arboricola TaxID=56448 RepID=UPI000CEF366D|nr:DUF4276 family protein [Xanthomonas arboricola]MBB5860971.1 hypothetical protein [Xanthomonas arboricola]PPT58247.1 hypothetical protein XarbCFBP8138_00635 [Xanthomonas arboricola]
MTIHVLVEGPSETAFLEGWTPRLKLPQSFRIHPHQGKGSLPADIDSRPERWKRGLLDQLPAKLRGFAQSLNPNTDGILVLIDSDNDDIKILSSSISQVAASLCPDVQVGICIATEEMEAFYLADLAALGNAYPDFDTIKASAYIPDSICGTWELFGDIIGDDGGNKVSWANNMGKYVTTIAARSRSNSFRNTLKVFNKLGALPIIETSKPRKFKHRTKKSKE